MRPVPILSRAGLRELERFASESTALVLDYDGTISPIVSRIAEAEIPSRRKRLLRQVARLYPCAVLSGRKLSDLRARVRGCGFDETVGNHGIEWRGSPISRAHERRMRRCRREIECAIRDGRIRGAGIELEYKRVTLSVHYRRSRDHKRAYREILSVLCGLEGTQIIEGKEVFNLLPRTRLNKGTAVVALRKRFRCERVIYLGDDWTDEKVFELRPKPFLLDVRVGRCSRSRARYYLPNIAAMDPFLKELIRLRTAREGP